MNFVKNLIHFFETKKIEKMNPETIDNVLEDMFHYAKLAVTGDNEKKIIKEFADRVKLAWDREKDKRIMCCECGDTTHIDDVDEEGLCNICRSNVEEGYDE